MSSNLPETNKNNSTLKTLFQMKSEYVCKPNKDYPENNLP